jgi:hypothetical protein
MQLHGYFDNTQQHHIDAMRYCFSPVVQKQLSDLVIEWNNHRVWKNMTAEAPGGIPEVLYFSPESSGGKEHKHPVDTDLLTYTMEYAGNLVVNGDFQEYADALCSDFNITYPPTMYED